MYSGMHVHSDEFQHTCGYLCNQQQNQDTGCFLHLRKLSCTSSLSVITASGPSRWQSGFDH